MKEQNDWVVDQRTFYRDTRIFSGGAAGCLKSRDLREEEMHKQN